MDAYIGEIRAFAFSYIPQGWLLCNGQVVGVTQYQALYALLGNVYGGNLQQRTFGLPNLQSMAPIGLGQGIGLTVRAMGQHYGSLTETVNTIGLMGAHNHSVNAMAPTTGSNLTNNTLSTPVANSSWLSQEGKIKDATHFSLPKAYVPATSAFTPDIQFPPQTIDPACGVLPGGGALPHSNVQPYLTMGMFICWQGIFPPYN